MPNSAVRERLYANGFSIENIAVQELGGYARPSRWVASILCNKKSKCFYFDQPASRRYWKGRADVKFTEDRTRHWDSSYKPGKTIITKLPLLNPGRVQDAAAIKEFDKWTLPRQPEIEDFLHAYYVRACVNRNPISMDNETDFRGEPTDAARDSYQDSATAWLFLGYLEPSFEKWDEWFKDF